MSPPSPATENPVVAALCDQSQDLANIHDHVTRVIANLDINAEWFSGYNTPERAKFDLVPVVRMFLYQRVRRLSQSELERRLTGAAYVYVRVGLERPPSQQLISYMWRNRFSFNERQIIKQAAGQIREICSEHDLVRDDEPALDPADIRGEDIEEECIMDAVKQATNLGLTEFTADRASNAKYPLEAYVERQGYLNMANAGTTTLRRRFARISERDEVPHGSSHNRTMKKIADPDEQRTLNEYEDGCVPPKWQFIRDEILPAFHVGVEKQLDEIAGRNREGIPNIVNAAIDITSWNFWASPFKDEEDVADEQPVVVNGREKYPKDEYPEMVSGLKESHERGYKFATLTIVAEDTPIVLGIEPVRDNRAWEEGDPKSTSRTEIVERLLKQAGQHVDLHKVYADKEFDSHGVRDVIDRYGCQYVLGGRKNAQADFTNIEEAKKYPGKSGRVEWAKGTYEGRTHNVSIIYHPVDDEGEEYTVFTTNELVGPDRAMGLARNYRDRWEIENEYKTIKEHFLPTSASKDYRIRFLYFVLGTILFNVWRLTNFILRDDVDVHLGEKPPIRAGEIVELFAVSLFDPGG